MAIATGIGDALKELLLNMHETKWVKWSKQTTKKCTQIVHKASLKLRFSAIYCAVSRLWCELCRTISCVFRYLNWVNILNSLRVGFMFINWSLNRCCFMQSQCVSIFHLNLRWAIIFRVVHSFQLNKGAISSMEWLVLRTSKCNSL